MVKQSRPEPIPPELEERIPRTRRQFRDALAKGLGRAVLAMQREFPRSFIPELRDACVRYMGYNHLFEDGRAEWLYRLFGLAGRPSTVRRAVLEVLAEPTQLKWAELSQACALASLLGIDGDEDAATLLRRKFTGKYKEKSCRNAGISALLHLDGINGLTYLSKCFAKALQTDQSCAFDLVWHAEDVIGKRKVAEALRNDPALRELREQADRQRKEFEKRRELKPPQQKPQPYAQIQTELSQLRRLSDRRWRGKYRRWGTSASDEALRLAAEDFVQCRRRAPILCYLQLFQFRTFPLPPDRLLELAKSRDQEVSRSACQALRKMDRPEVRREALARLNERPLLAPVLEMLIGSYRLEDRPAVEAALPFAAFDKANMHWTSCYAESLFARFPSREQAGLLLWAYDNTPCSFCREGMVKRLGQHRLAPEWMLAECLHDSQEDTRVYARRWQTRRKRKARP